MSLRVVSFKADPVLLEALEAIARKTNRSKSEIIREAIRKYIQEEQKKCKPYITKRIRVYPC